MQVRYQAALQSDETGLFTENKIESNLAFAAEKSNSYLTIVYFEKIKPLPACAWP